LTHADTYVSNENAATNHTPIAITFQGVKARDARMSSTVKPKNHGGVSQDLLSMKPMEAFGCKQL
jgi:hypothetical protein